MTDRLRYGLFATLLAVSGIALSALGFMAAWNPAAARLAASSEGVAALVTGLSFTAVASALVLYYGQRSAQLTTAYQDLHRATLQRERSEAALRESERFTRATLDAMDAQIAVLDADGVVMAVNRAWRAAPHPLLCAAGTCDVGSNYLTMCAGVTDGRAAEAARVAAAIRAITSGERDDCLLESHVLVDGRLVVTRATRFAGRGPLRLVVSHQDVTTLAHPMQEPAPGAPAVDPLAYQAPIGLFRADTLGGLTHANHHFRALTGMDLDGALGTGWLHIVHPDDRDAAVAEWQRLIDARASGEGRFRIVRPDGAVRDCLLHVHAVDGDPPAFVGAVVDVTALAEAPARDVAEPPVAADLDGRLDQLGRERDRLAMAFRATEAERTRIAGEVLHLYDDAPCGYHALDADGVIVAVNETACGWLGYRRGELVGERRFAELLSPSSATLFADALRGLDDHGGARTVELELARKDGSLLAVSARLSAVRDADGNPAGSRAALVDVTDRRRAIERAETLEEALAARTAELEDASRRLDDASRRLEEATRERQASSRPAPESPAGVVRAPVDMAALAREVVDDVCRRHPAREVPVSIDGLAPARGDAARLRELLDQLIDNAFKYTAAVTHPYVDLGSVDGEGGPVYYVRDNGAGFDMRRAGRLFHDLDGPNGSEGLALVQRVVEEHGGRVWAEGRIDGGATFFFTLHEPLRIGPPREPGHVDFGRALESATGVGLDRPAVRPS